MRKKRERLLLSIFGISLARELRLLCCLFALPCLYGCLLYGLYGSADVSITTQLVQAMICPVGSNLVLMGHFFWLGSLYRFYEVTIL